MITADPETPNSPSAAGEEENPYGLVFWICYVANATLTLAFSLLFRYADFVAQIGGNEMQLGLIVGVGMVGALSMRVVQGVGIDRFGPRLVWLVSLAMFSISCLLHLYVERADTPAVYLVRILLTTGTAGAFGASLTYISLRVPEHRVAEMIGTLGSSGFIGIALGPVLGDLLFASAAGTRAVVDRMFLVAAGAAFVSLVLVAIATRGKLRRHGGRRRLPVLWLVRRYHPGPMLMMGVAMGLGLGLPHVFLRAYTIELGIDSIQSFFIVYAVTAFVVRIITRRWCDWLGYRAVVLLGMGILLVGMLLFLPVRDPWLLALPAVLCGSAHAFLFPAVIGGGTTSFPSRYRGLSTTLMLATFDLGNLFGQPLIGLIVHTAKQLALPAYPTMFVCVAVILGLISFEYARRSRPSQQPPGEPNRLNTRAVRLVRRRTPDLAAKNAKAGRKGERSVVVKHP